MRVVGLIQLKHAGESGELALHVGDHHVLDLELGGGVCGIDVPGGYGAGGGGICGGRSGSCHGSSNSFHLVGCTTEIFVVTTILVRVGSSAYRSLRRVVFRISG